MKFEKCTILGVNIQVTNIKEAIEDIKNNIEILKGKYICFTNVHTIVTSYENPKYAKIQNESFISFPDGKPLSLYARKHGYKKASQVAGPDFMEAMWEATENTELTHYFYGGSTETIEKLRTALNKKYPKLKIAGMESPPYRELTSIEDAKAVKRINDSKADFLWVGLGAPKQEIWMWKHRRKELITNHQVNALMLGVGAGFDFHAGTVNRAPAIFQKLYLEWLYRLLQDPKRLFRRYFKTNLKYLIYINKENKEQKNE